MSLIGLKKGAGVPCQSFLRKDTQEPRFTLRSPMSSVHASPAQSSCSFHPRVPWHLGDGVEQRDVTGRHAQQHLLGPDAALAVHDRQLPRGVLYGVHSVFLAQAERYQVLARAMEKAVSPRMMSVGLESPGISLQACD